MSPLMKTASVHSRRFLLSSIWNSCAVRHVLDTKTDVVVRLFRSEVFTEVVDPDLPEVSILDGLIVHVFHLESLLVATAQHHIVHESPHIVCNFLLQEVLSQVVAFNEVAQFAVDVTKFDEAGTWSFIFALLSSLEDFLANLLPLLLQLRKLVHVVSHLDRPKLSVAHSQMQCRLRPPC